MSHVRKITRKNTGLKMKAEADGDDILLLLMEADRVKVNLPRFAVIYINTLPHVPLEEVDGGVIMEKVAASMASELEGTVKSIKESLASDIDTASLDCDVMLREMTSNLKKDVHSIVQEIGEELKVIRQKTSEVTAILTKVKKQRYKANEELDSMSLTMEEKCSVEKCSVEKSEQGCSYADKVKLGQKQDHSTEDNNNVVMNGVEERDRRKGTWTLAGSLKRRKVTALVGAKKETGRLMGVERKARDTWDVYVGNLVDSVTETHVVEYTKVNGV